MKIEAIIRNVKQLPMVHLELIFKLTYELMKEYKQKNSDVIPIAGKDITDTLRDDKIECWYDSKEQCNFVVIDKKLSLDFMKSDDYKEYLQEALSVDVLDKEITQGGEDGC